MAKWVALLRGINVGGNTILPMKELTAMAQSLGWKNVETYIQSGNMVFEADAPDGSTLQAAVAAAKGIAPRVILMTQSDLETIAKACPFESQTGKDVHVYFLEGAPNEDEAALDALAIEGEKWALSPQAFYLFAPSGVGRSKLAAAVEKRLGVAATARNWNTVTKLREMLG